MSPPRKTSERMRALPIEGPAEAELREQERVAAHEKARAARLGAMVELNREQDYQGAVLAWLVRSFQVFADHFGIELDPVPVDPNAETQPLPPNGADADAPQESRDA